MMKQSISIGINNPIIRNHIVFGKPILPGLAYIDLIYQFLRQNQFNYSDIGIKNFSIHRPLEVDLVNDIELQVVCNEVEIGIWQLEITEPKINDIEVTSKTYLTAEIVLSIDNFLNFPNHDLTIDLSKLEQKNLDNVYRDYEKRNVVHKAFMKAKGTIYKEKNEIYVEVLPSSVSERTSNYFMFNPVLLDGSAMGNLVTALDYFENPDLYLPISFESFYAFELIQNYSLTKLNLLEIADKSGLLYFTIEFFNSKFDKIAEIKNFVCKRISDDSKVFDTRIITPKFESISDSTQSSRKTSLRNSDYHSYLRDLISRKANIPANRFKDQTPFYDIGLESSQMIEIIQDIKKFTKLDLPPTLLFECTNLSELSSYILSILIRGNNKMDGGRYEKNKEFTNFNEPIKDYDSEDFEQRKNESITSSIDNFSNASKSLMNRNQGIAIVGVSGTYPGAKNLDEFWMNLSMGIDCISDVPKSRWNHSEYIKICEETKENFSQWGGFIDDVELFDPLFFGISPREAKIMDPMQRVFLENVWNLFETYGYTRKRISKNYKGDVGVFVGAMYQHYSNIRSNLIAQSEASMYSFSAIANRISHFFNLKGPSLAIDSMCSSSSLAIHLACESLRNQECKMAVAGGVNLTISPNKYIGLSRMQLTGKSKSSRSFGKGDGYIPSEGVGSILLKTIDLAISDNDNILGIIKSTHTNHDGKSNNFLTPNLKSQTKLIEDNFKKSGIDPKTIGYVEASCNGSPLGDSIEVNALANAFRKFTNEEQFCAIGSVKSNIGHAEAASGISQITKVLLQIKHQKLTPTIHSSPLNPNINLKRTPFYIQKELTQWNRLKERVHNEIKEIPRRAAISSLAAGGSNVHMIVEEFVKKENEVNVPNDENKMKLFIFSATSNERLKVLVERFLSYLHENDNINLIDLSYTLQIGREEMDFRVAFLAKNYNELCEVISSFLNDLELNKKSLWVSGNSLNRIVNETEIQYEIGKKQMDELEYYKIAKSWVKGMEIPWEQFYQKSRHKMLSLPNYPFHKKKYWITESEKLIPPEKDLVDLSEATDEFSLNSENEILINIKKFIFQFLSRELHIDQDQVIIEKDLQSYGFSSLLIMKFIRSIQKHFDVKLTILEIIENRTILELSNYIFKSFSSNGTDNKHFKEKNIIESVSIKKEAKTNDSYLSKTLDKFKGGELSLDQMEILVTQTKRI